MTGVAYCGCGHTLDDHVRGAVCRHVNRASKRFPTSAPCGCRRFHPCPGLPDSEEFLAKQLNALIAKQRLSLESVERDDLLQVMRISLWRASAKYDSRSHIRFGSYAAMEVCNDAIDEMRSARMFGRQGQHRLPPPLPSPTDADGNWDFEQPDPQDEHDRGDGRLARVVAELTIDAPDAGSVDLRWAESQRDSEAIRAVRDRRLSTRESVEDGDHGAAWQRGLAALTTTHEEAA